MSIVCFDTNIFIWGVKKMATKGQEDNILKAENLISQCQINKINIAIPSVVLAELFAGLPTEKHAQFYAQISRLGMILPFDTKAGFEFGKLSRSKSPYRQTMNIPRQEMKADMMIVATAIANKADCIYSEDEGLRKVADTFIEVRRLPGFAQQTNLFNS